MMLPSRRRRRPTPSAAPGTEALPEASPGTSSDDGVLVEEVGGPRRRCAATREQGTRAGMLRFVVAPDRRAIPDLAATLPGRGIWLSARRDVLEPARVRGALARAARGPVQVPPDLIQILEAGLVRRLTDTLGLARRAGQAVAGFAKAREWLAEWQVLGQLSGQVPGQQDLGQGLVVQASDGSPAERARFLSGAPGVRVVAPLDAAGLGAVFGRDHVVHVAVQPGRLAGQLATDAERLAGVTGRQDIVATGPERVGSSDGQVGIPVGGGAAYPGEGGRTGA